MAEVIDEIIGKEAFAQIERLESGLKGLVDTFIKSSNAAKLLEAALLKESTVKGVNDAIKQQKTQLSELEKYQKQMESQILKLAFAERELGKQRAKNAVELEQQNAVNKTAAREQLAAEGSINQMSASLVKMRREYDALSKTMRESPLGAELVKRIQATDAALKAMDGNTGRFQRNVGDYKNQLFGLTQVFRELPGFTYSAQTGILGLSNNLPILAENFKTVAAATNEVTGKVNGTVGAMKIFASSILSFGNIFAIAIGLFTIFSKEIFAFFQNTEKAKNMVDQLTESFARLDKEIAFNNQHLDKQAKLQLAAAKARGASETEINQIEQSNLQKRLELYDDEISKQIEVGAGYQRVLNLKKAGSSAITESLEDLQKVVDESESKLQSLQNARADIAIDLQIAKYKVPKPQVEVAKRDNIGKGTKEDRKKEIEDYEHDLYQLDQDIQQMNEKTDKETIERVHKRLEEIKRLNAQYAKDELDLIKENLEAQQRDWDNYDKEREDALRKQLALYNQLGDIAQAVTGAISAVSDILYQKEISQIDERDKKLEDSYDQEKKQIESKYLTQAQKEKELAQLESRREQERKAIERERVAAARRNAQRQKQLDVANIITTTALAIMGALSRGKTDGPTAYAQAIAVGITGATQLARAIAAPLPQYKDGTLDHKGGFAVVGDGGVSELVVEPDGTAYLTPSKSTVMDLPKHSQVFNPEQMMQGVYNLAYKQLGNGQKVTTDKMQVAMLESFNKLADEMKGVKKEIRNIKLGVNLHGDMEHFLTMKNIIS